MSWQVTDKGLYRQFKFPDFITAMKFIQHAAVCMEKVNHHASWTNQYNIVEVWMSTHSEGNAITEKDYNLAAELDTVFNELK